MTRVVLAAHLTMAGVILAALVASWRVRRHDAVLWHTIWTTIAVAAVVAPIAAMVLPPLMLPMPEALAARIEGWSLPAASPGWGGSALVATYAAGSLLLALRLAAGVLLAGRLARQSYVPHGHWRARLQTLAGDDALRCRLHARVQVPMTVGVHHGLVLLPESWIHWDDDRVSSVLRHELAHVRRRDYAWNIAGAIAQALYWPNPLIWIATARLRLAAELASDQDASAQVGATRYAGVLVASARELMVRGRGASRLAPGAASNLDARIGALLAAGGAAPSRPRPGLRIVIAAAIAVAILAGLAIRITPGAGTDTHTHAGH